MKEKVPVSVYIVTTLLVLYTISISLNAPLRIISFLFFLSPVLLTWMFVSVLKSKDYNGKDLAEGEEWDYADKKKDELGIF